MMEWRSLSGLASDWRTLSTAISPPVPGVEIVPIAASEGRSYFVSFRSEKLSRASSGDGRGHWINKRANFKNRAMEDYEIRDVFARRDVSPSLIVVDVDIRKGSILDLVVRNVGDLSGSEISDSATN